MALWSLAALPPAEIGQLTGLCGQAPGAGKEPGKGCLLQPSARGCCKAMAADAGLRGAKLSHGQFVRMWPSHQDLPSGAEQCGRQAQCRGGWQSCQPVCSTPSPPPVVPLRVGWLWRGGPASQGSHSAREALSRWARRAASPFPCPPPAAACSWAPDRKSVWRGLSWQGGECAAWLEPAGPGVGGGRLHSLSRQRVGGRVAVGPSS